MDLAISASCRDTSLNSSSEVGSGILSIEESLSPVFRTIARVYKHRLKYSYVVLTFMQDNLIVIVCDICDVRLVAVNVVDYDIIEWLRVHLGRLG